MNDSFFMKKAISLALKGSGHTNPNPLVGCVIVRDKKIIAQGFHHKYGELHAERDALKNAYDNNIDVSGATMFVTLEPCCHHGKQPPCTDAIIESKIKKVVIGSRDPNPLVNGKGKKILEAAGIQVVTDFMRAECDAINEIFFHYIKTKTPYVVLKYAMTADGMSATYKGKSQWITGDTARKNVHIERSKLMAVMTGINTVLSDNPLLTVRLKDKTLRQPVRVVIDSKLKIDKDSNLVKTACEVPLFIFTVKTTFKKNSQKVQTLTQSGAKIFAVSSYKDGHTDLREVLKILGENSIDSVLVESGGFLNASLLFSYEKPLANEIHAYIAPKIFGNDGNTVFCPVRGLGTKETEGCIKLFKPQIEFFDDDVLLKYKLNLEEA